MIQRVQSILLAVTAISMFSLLFFPIWGQQNNDIQQVVELNVYKLKHTKGEEINEKNTIYLAGLALISATIAVASILSYKNRLKQMKLNLLNSILIGGTLVGSALLMFKGEDLFKAGKESAGLQVGFFLIATALLANALANRFIRRDDKHVRSADRLR